MNIFKNVRIKIHYNENYFLPRTTIYTYFNSDYKNYIIHIPHTLLKYKGLKTIIFHEMGHIVNDHCIGSLEEEIIADNFSITKGGEIKYILPFINIEDKEYYGEYIHEPIKRKLLLLLKQILKNKEKN